MNTEHMPEKHEHQKHEHHGYKWEQLPWQAWGSWYSWGSPVGLSIFLCSLILASGLFLMMLHQAALI